MLRDITNMIEGGKTKPYRVLDAAKRFEGVYSNGELLGVRIFFKDFVVDTSCDEIEVGEFDWFEYEDNIGLAAAAREHYENNTI